MYTHVYLCIYYMASFSEIFPLRIRSAAVSIGIYMCIYVRMYTYICLYACKYLFILMYIYVYMHIYIYVYTHTIFPLLIRSAAVSIGKSLFVNDIYLSISICMYVCMYVYTCGYVNILHG
jgi:hypothetical protein